MSRRLSLVPVLGFCAALSLVSCASRRALPGAEDVWPLSRLEIVEAEQTTVLRPYEKWVAKASPAKVAPSNPWRLRVVAMPKGVAQRLFRWSGIGANVASVDSVELNSVLDELASKPLPLVHVIDETVVPDENTAYSKLDSIAYVKEFEVTVRDSAWIADPIIGVAQSGFAVSLCDDPRSEEEPKQIEIKWGVVRRPIPLRNLASRFTIQTPMLSLRRVAARVAIKPRKTLAVLSTAAPLADPDTVSVVLVSSAIAHATPAAPATR